MNYCRNICLFLLLTGCSSAFTAPLTDLRGYWKCVSQDAKNKRWLSESNFQKSALNKAFAACKKNSIMPLSCNKLASNCEGYNQKKESAGNWQCSALDKNADIWQSNFSALRDEAATGARNYCKSKSAVPDTCYINWSSCDKTLESF